MEKTLPPRLSHTTVRAKSASDAPSRFSTSDPDQYTGKLPPFGARESYLVYPPVGGSGIQAVVADEALRAAKAVGHLQAAPDASGQITLGRSACARRCTARLKITPVIRRSRYRTCVEADAALAWLLPEDQARRA